MSRYYFDIVDGTRIGDEEGQDLPDLIAARETAVGSARDIMAHAIWDGRLPIDEPIEVTDRSGYVVMTVPFRETVEFGGSHLPQWSAVPNRARGDVAGARAITQGARIAMPPTGCLSIAQSIQSLC